MATAQLHAHIGRRMEQGSEEHDSAHDATRAAFRDALGARCQALDSGDPGVLDLVAEVLVELHERLRGQCVKLSGQRTDKQFREQLRGERAMTLEDIARLALHAPEALAPGLSAIAEACGYTLVADSREARKPVLVEIAEATSAAADLNREAVQTQLGAGGHPPEETIARLQEKLRLLETETAEAAEALKRERHAAIKARLSAGLR